MTVQGCVKKQQPDGMSHRGLEAEMDVDKLGSPPSYQIFPSRLRMLCAKMCAPDMGCRGSVLRATCSVNAQHRDEMRWQRTLCSL